VAQAWEHSALKLNITNSILGAEIAALESALNCRVPAADGRGIKALLSEQFYEFGASGTLWTRAAILEALEGVPAADVQMTDVRVLSVGEDTVLLTYRSRRVATRESSESNSLRSSIWSRADGSWQMIFHQGTLVV
jgi:hypothetical protein